MQKGKDFACQQLELIRDKILNSYLTTIEDSFREQRSQLKLTNYGTGSGKTHQLFQAICTTIQKYPEIQTIGIYVAPLREHLSVPAEVRNKYPDIPVYTINSLEMKTTDKHLDLYKKWIPSILKNKIIWKVDYKKISHQELDEVQQNLQQVPNIINRFKFIQGFDFGDKTTQDNQTKKLRNNLISSIEKFLVFLINSNSDKNNWSDECLKLIEIFFPLYLMRKKSGILMLTYDKFETKIQYFKHNGEKWIKQSKHLDKYVVQNANNSTKFILAFDEQEDGYKIMLRKKIDIISPEEMAINNALSSIYREFALLFAKKNEQNIKLLNFLDRHKGAYYEFQEHLEKGKILDSQLQKYLKLYQKITAEEGNSIQFIQHLISINKGIEESLTEIVAIFDNDDEESPIALNFEMLSRVLAKFENTKTLLIPQELYSNIGDDLMNIFSYNNLYIYNIKSLQNLYLSKPSGGHVRITEKKVSDKTSVAELIYVILAMRSQIEKTKKILINVLDAEDSQSHALDIWSRQISKVKKADEENATQIERGKNPYLDRQYVYESNKPIVNIKEISRYQNPKNNLIDPKLREVSIGSTAIFTSPEHKISSIVANNANVVFLISATGGLSGDLTTSYDMRYLEDKLRYESGDSALKAMTESEISLCGEIRNYRQQHRQITVDCFSQDLASFPNQKTKQVAKRFESQILKDFIRDVKVPNIYKKRELSKFIHFLFYLFEDDSIQETIAFTQTLRWIKQLTEYCTLINHANFIFEKSPEHPSIYYVQIKHKQYQSKVRIKLILYKASFNKDYYDKTNQKTYLDELVEKEGEKIYFISAYQSASKGLNPIVKTQDGTDKDFDSLVLLMDAFYTDLSSSSKMPKNKEADKSTTLYHFSLMKHIVNLSDSHLEIKDFNQYLSTPEASAFRQQQHQILLGKGIVQAIGRAERRDFPAQVMKIFMNDETRKNLQNFYNYLEQNEPNEIRKLSVNNYAVYQEVLAESKKQAVNNYDDHIYDEIDAVLVFQEFKKKILNEIQLFHHKKNTFDVQKAWDGLRDATVFKSPSQYLDNLRNLGIFSDEFIDSLFYSNTEQSKFTPYIAWEEDNGKKFPIISDSINGDRIYNYQNRLYPEYIKTNSQGYDLEGNEIGLLNPSTKLIGELYNNLIPRPEVFENYIPRYNFFYDILYPSLTENFVERWIKDIIFNGKDPKAIKDAYNFEQLIDLPKYSQLYEQFDIYYIQNNILFCIDVKAWSKASGNRLSIPTVSKAKKKLKTIAKNYPEFNTVKGLLLNLHASKEKIIRHSSTLFSGNLIYFDSRNCPVESTVLRNFLFPKNK